MNAEDEILKKRLEWVSIVLEGLLRALGSDVIVTPAQIQRTVDSIRMFVTIQLKRKLTDNNREPMRTFIRCWAKRWDCEIPTITIEPKKIVIEVLTKRRHFKTIGDKEKL